MDKAITRHPIKQFSHLVEMLKFIEVDGKFICHHTHTQAKQKKSKSSSNFTDSNDSECLRHFADL